MNYAKVIIETEGGGAKGLGHIYRAIALASNFPGAKIALRNESVPLNSLLNHGMRATMREREQAHVLIRDMREEWYQASTATRLVVDIVDDVSEAYGKPDILFAAHGKNGPGVYSGLRYAILRQEFADHASPPWERDTVLVCLGGVDPSSATMRLVAALYSGVPTKVACVTGPGSPWGEGGPGPVWRALARAPLAIVSAGTTLLECAAMGVPALVVSHNDRESERAQRMLKEGCEWFQYLGPTSLVDAEALRAAVLKLLDSPHSLDAMSRAGRAAVDGCGAWRVGAILRRKIALL